MKVKNPLGEFIFEGFKGAKIIKATEIVAFNLLKR